MNKNTKLKIIQEAQNRLSIEAFDLLHDNYHHYAVWQNCMEIYFIENPEVDLDLLEIACWWHDYGKSDVFNTEQEELSPLQNCLEENNIGKSDIEKIYRIMDEHKFESEQTSNESKILFDADKLEYVSIPRWHLSYQFIDTKTRTDYEIKFVKAIDKIRERLNFDYSRKLFEIRFLALMNIAEGKKWLIDKSLYEKI